MAMARPPGITVKPSVVEATNRRMANGCGTSPCGVKAGVVPKPMRSSATSDSPCSAISSLRARRCASVRLEPSWPYCAPPGRPVPSCAWWMTMRSRLAMTCWRFAASPSHRRGASAMSRSSPNRCLADRREVGAEPAVLRHGRAERIAHQIGRLAARLHEAARPTVACGVELERIGLAAVDAAHDEVDALQSFQRLQEDAVARGAQIAALDQQIAEVAGEIGVAEVVVVVRARRQQRDARIAAAGEQRQVGLHALEERREAHGR